MQALNDYVILKKEDKEEESAIVVSDSNSKQAGVEMEIISVGPDVEGLKAGETVYLDGFRPRALTKTKEEELFVLQAKYIWAKK